MTPTPQRARNFPPRPQEEHPLEFTADQPLELTSDQMVVEPAFDRQQWSQNRAETSGAGGRQVLGTGLSMTKEGLRPQL